MSQLYTDFLAPYIPQSALAMVAEQLAKYKVRVVITNPRKSKHGDYRAHHRGHRHQISINGNLNSYAFLETLLHEYAHLLVDEQYGKRVQSHGIEWQDMYRQVLQPYLAANVFPADVAAVIQHHTQKTTIGACNSPEMTKVFKQYDPPKQGEQALSVALETLPYYACFKNENGKVFVKYQLRRTKYICIEVSTGYVWTFNALADVVPIATNDQTQDVIDVLTALQTPNSNNRFVKLGSLSINSYFTSLDGVPKQLINKASEKITCKNLINHKLYIQHQFTLVIPTDKPNLNANLITTPTNVQMAASPPSIITVESIPDHSFFRHKNKLFLKVKLARTKYDCLELSTGDKWSYGGKVVVEIASLGDLNDTELVNAMTYTDWY